MLPTEETVLSSELAIPSSEISWLLEGVAALMTEVSGPFPALTTSSGDMVALFPTLGVLFPDMAGMLVSVARVSIGAATEGVATGPELVRGADVLASVNVTA